MARRISWQRQRVPMVDADILEDRTRPPPELSRRLRLRLNYTGWGGSTSGLLAFIEARSDGPRPSPSSRR